MTQSSEEPCPVRILTHTGTGYALGLSFGSIYNFGKGFKNAPKGLTNRFLGAVSAARRLSPITAAGFALWSVTYAATDCSLVYIRKKEDSFNGIASGAISGSLLSIRRGLGSMIWGGVFGGVALAAIEGAVMFMNRTGAQAANAAPPNVHNYEGVEYYKP